MSEISMVLSKLKGTHEEEILLQIEDVYSDIKIQQQAWYEKTDFRCIDGCGECCRNFEPDLLESEVLYMAAWLIENLPETAEQVASGNFPFGREKGCQFWNEKADYHCSIYEGRPLICRLFGASSSYSKTGDVVWKPCRFYPAQRLSEHKPPLAHKQYSASETRSLLGEIPPAMSDFTEKIVASISSEQTELIRDILPETISRLMWVIKMNESSEEK